MLRSKDIDRIWKVWSESAEDFLHKVSDPELVNDRPERFRGRGILRQPVTRRLIPARARAVKGTVPVRLGRLLKIGRKLDEPLRQLSPPVADPTGAIPSAGVGQPPWA